MSATAALPTALPVDVAGIPAALKDRPQWVCWRFKRTEDGRWTKEPVSVKTGGLASSTNPASWTTLGDALAYADVHGLAGVGYVFSADDPFCGVDLDTCRDAETGVLDDWAQEHVGTLDSYTEPSPSGTGAHVIIRGTKPGTRARYKRPDGSEIEVYDRGRYFTITGQRLPGAPATVNDRQAQLEALYAALWPEPDQPPPPNGHHPPGGLTDGEIIKLASEAANGDKLRRLFYDGDVGLYDGDESRADAALCAMLAFFTRDPGQIDRIFGRSALGQRDKWTRRSDYRARTIRHALETVTESYTPPTPKDIRGVLPSANGRHDSAEQDEGETATGAAGARHAAKTWPALDPAALYGLAGDVVDVIDGHTEADKVATLGTFLLMFGSAVGRSPHLMVGNDRHGLNEFLALVGETAKARKGSSQGGPRRALEYADQQWARERVQGGLSSGEGLLAAIADPIVRVNKKGEEETVFEGSADKRLLCIEEELSQLLKVAGRQGNIISEIVRRGWDSRETLRTMTKASPLTVTGPHISIVGHITADELRRELDDTARANGFGNRFLWLCVRRSKAEPFLEPMPEATVTGLGRRIQHALIHARKTTRVQLDDTARVMWRDVYPDLSDGRPGLVGSLTARAEAHALRLALIYALLDCSNAITGDHLIAALAFIDYAEASVRYIFGDATGDPIADRILAALRANGAMAQNGIYDFFGRNVASNRIGLALETLLAAGLVRMSKEETGGRPRTVWSAFP